MLSFLGYQFGLALKLFYHVYDCFKKDMSLFLNGELEFKEMHMQAKKK
jgi:hypothetical protein